MSLTPKSRRIPLGYAYSATQVNATIFRVSTLVSAGGFQFATYYDPDGTLVVTRRRLPEERWESVRLPVKGNIRDAHNGAVIGVSGDGIVHLSYNHHDNPLHYRRTARPYDIRSFGSEMPMTGKTERRVSYPQFVRSPRGALYFFYRDGASGNGNLCLNRYDPERKAWSALHHPLIDGQGKCNPYWWRPSVGADGTVHLAWCWRDTPDARSNHDICYMRSSDGGGKWQSAGNQSQPLPAVLGNSPTAALIPTGSNLINQCSSDVDAAGHPHIAYYANDASGVPQYMHLWHDGTRWQRNVVSRRKNSFSLGGGGTLRIPISRPEIAVTQDGGVTLITRDADAGGNIRLYRSKGRDYSRWETVDLTSPGEDLGEWEPTYDVARLRSTGILSLFVLTVHQGDHETVTGGKPQLAYVLETPLY